MVQVSTISVNSVTLSIPDLNLPKSLQALVPGNMSPCLDTNSLDGLKAALHRSEIDRPRVVHTRVNPGRPDVTATAQ